jgi:hypothetical protein
MVSSAILSTDISIINTIFQVNVIDLLSYNIAIVGTVKGAFTIVKLRPNTSREAVVKR